MSEEKLKELILAKMEAEDLDYKEYLYLDSQKAVLELCEDIMAMANSHGGYVVFGVDNSYKPQGLPSSFHVDEARIQQIIFNYMKPVAEVTYAEKSLKVDSAQEKFAFLHVKQSDEVIVAFKDGTWIDKTSRKTSCVFRSGDIYVRKGSRSVRADSDSVRLLLQRMGERAGKASAKTALSAQEMEELQIQPRHNLQRPDYKQFIGREEYVEDILGKLDQRFFVISIDGIGGVGKTALALEIAYRCLQQRRFHAIVWVSAKRKKLVLTGIEDIVPSLTSYETLLNTVLEVLGFGASTIESLDEKEKQVGRLLRTVKCLIVVDNLETVEDERIFDFLKNLPEPSKALITSRKRLGEVERVVALKEMSFEEAGKLVQMDARDKQVSSLLSAPIESMKNIYEVTSGIPLAIRWVVGWISVGHEISWVCDKVKKKDSPVLDFCFKEIYETLLCPSARTVLCLMPIFDHNPAREELEVTASIPYEKFEEGIAQLLRLSLINSDIRSTPIGTKTFYGILPLTLSFAQAKLSENRGLEVEARKRLAVYFQREQKQREALEQYGYALERIGATTEKGKLAALQAQLAFAAYQRGNYPESVKLFKGAVEADPNLSYTYQLWAMIERQEGNIGKADELFGEASRLNPTNPIIWRSWAMMKKELKDLDQSERILKTGLEYLRNDKATMHSLAVIKSIKKEYNEADRLFEMVYTPSPHTFDEKKNNMYVFAARAENLRKWGESEERKDLLDSSKKKYMLGLGLVYEGLHFDSTDWNLIKNRIRLFASLARVESKMGSFDVAEEFYRQAIFFSPKNPTQREHNSSVYYSRALNFIKMGKIDDALRMCEESIAQAYNSKALETKQQLLKKSQALSMR
jgi:tetratricopeptide (TPR) repeat protein